MSMRYLIRRAKPEDYSEVKTQVSALEEKLGTPGESMRRFIEVPVSKSQYAVFQFFTRKSGANWEWTCPSLELVAESENDFYALTKKFNVPDSALSHLPLGKAN